MTATDDADGRSAARFAALIGAPDVAGGRQVTLPVEGPGAPVIEAQGRRSDDDLSPDGLSDLITSIAACGQLQRVGVEELPDGRWRLVFGERRLRALRYGRQLFPDHPHFRGGTVDATVLAPVDDFARRAIQFVENFARKDLGDADAAAQLLYARAGLLLRRAATAGVSPPEELVAEADPVERWRRLDGWRRSSGMHQIGAPWRDVLGEVGLNLSERRAQQIVGALSTLPDDITTRLNELDVFEESRRLLARLARCGREDTIAELLEVAAATGRPKQLMSVAARAALADPDLDGAGAVAAAEADVAETERRRRSAGLASPPAALDLDNQPSPKDRPDVPEPALLGEPAPRPTSPATPSSRDEGPVPPTYAAGPAIRELRELTDALEAGYRLPDGEAAELRQTAEALLLLLA